MSAPSYRTLASDGSSEVVIKGSRFLGWAKPVAGADEVPALVEAARARWPHANHHAFAYRLRADDGRVTYRSSDDGEPGGTAGRPILAALDAQDVTGAVVIVSRIFGGVKLGTGGLARAYGRAGREALEDAGVREIAILDAYELVVPLELLGSVESHLFRAGVSFDERIVEPPRAVLLLELAPDDADALGEAVARVTAGRAVLRRRD